MPDRLACSACGEVNEEPGARFCGRCGSVLEIAEDTPAAVQEQAEESGEDEAAPLSRRSLVTGIAGLMLGGAAGALWTKHNASGILDPAVALPEATFEVGEVRQVMERIRSEGPMLFPREFPRVAVTIWDPKAEAEGRTASEVYGQDGEGHPVTEGAGFMALYLRSTHLGCAVPYCEASGWFEDPCHLSKWNSWGEWMWGDAPRGLDRYRSSIRPDGTLVVNLRAPITGPSTETRFGESEPLGPVCVEV